jgi:hypothetical protein
MLLFPLDDTALLYYVSVDAPKNGSLEKAVVHKLLTYKVLIKGCQEYKAEGGFCFVRAD